jgi:hypothetical protein
MSPGSRRCRRAEARFLRFANVLFCVIHGGCCRISVEAGAVEHVLRVIGRLPAVCVWPRIPNRGESTFYVPYCAGRKVLAGYNDLATLRPDLAAQWHPTMNKKLKPTDVMPTSNKEVWWHGDCGHTWSAKVCDRNKPKVSSCSYCTSRRKPDHPVNLG